MIERNGGWIPASNGPAILVCATEVGLRARITLNIATAPAASALLLRMADHQAVSRATHARHSGAEVSCPFAAGSLPFEVTLDGAAEAPVTEPIAGDVVLVTATRGRWGDMPAFDLVDLGLFYGAGRLVFPFGAVTGTRCGLIVDDDLPALAEAAERLRGRGGCDLMLRRC